MELADHSDVSYEHLLHPIALHLPLQLLWRLIPLSRSFRRVLSAELFWKQRCLNEFPLLHDTVTNYREYFIKRTENYYGQLYIDGRLVSEVRRAQRLFVPLYSPRLFLLTRSNELYSIVNYGVPQLVATDVIRVVQWDRERLILVKRENNTSSCYKLSHEDSIKIEPYLHIPTIRTIFEVYDVIVLHTEDGKLFYHRENKAEIIPIPIDGLKIISLMRKHRSSSDRIHDIAYFDLTVVLSDGRVRVLHLTIAPDTINYELESTIDTSDEAILFDGDYPIETGTNERRRNWEVIVGTDGTGRLDRNFLRSSELRYEGIIDFNVVDNHNIFIATKQS